MTSRARIALPILLSLVFAALCATSLVRMSGTWDEYLVGIGTSDTLTELHEELFDWLLILIGLHIAAILLYRLALGRNLLGPMISGKADLPRGMEPLRPATPLVAIACTLIALAATAWIVAGAPLPGT